MQVCDGGFNTALTLYLQSSPTATAEWSVATNGLSNVSVSSNTSVLTIYVTAMHLGVDTLYVSLNGSLSTDYELDNITQWVYTTANTSTSGLALRTSSDDSVATLAIDTSVAAVGTYVYTLTVTDTYQARASFLL